MAISPDGTLVACGGFGQFRVSDVRTGRVVCQGWYDGIYSLMVPISSVHFSSDSKLLALEWPEDAGWRVYEARTGRLRRAVKHAHKGGVTTALISPDGQNVVSAGDDGRVRVWELATGKCLRTLDTGAGTVRKALYTPDGKAVLALCFRRGVGLTGAGAHAELQRWQTGPWRRQSRFDLPADRFGLMDLALSRDGRLVAVSSSGAVRVWKWGTADPIATLKTAKPITGLAFGPWDGALAIAGPAGAVTVWDIATKRALVRLDVGKQPSPPDRSGQARWVYGIATNATTHILCAVDRDTTVTAWRFEAKRPIAKEQGEPKAGRK